MALHTAGTQGPSSKEDGEPGREYAFFDWFDHEDELVDSAAADQLADMIKEEVGRQQGKGRTLGGGQDQGGGGPAGTQARSNPRILS